MSTTTATFLALAVSAAAVAEEPLADERFTYWPPTSPPPLQQIWGDVPEAIAANGVAAGAEGRPAELLKVRFAADKRPNGLSYWAFKLPQPIPLIDGLRRIEVTLRASAPVSLKVGLAPFGFIYHAAATTQGPGTQTLVLDRAAAELQAWCRKGQRDPKEGYLDTLILAIQTKDQTDVAIEVDRLAVIGDDGSQAQAHAEAVRRQASAVKIAAVSLPWSEDKRTLEAALDAITVGKTLGADVVALPQECVSGPAEPIPGPSFDALAAAAKQHGVYVVGNLREAAEGKAYVTSFLLGRDGRLIGKYRKSHKLPDEDMALGDELPVFETEFGKVAMKIGTDRLFPEIDHTYAAQGAQIVFWAQRPEPVEDEWTQDRPVPGMAIDYHLTYVCSRYTSSEPGYITNMYPTYLGRPLGRAYVVNAEGERVASTARTGGVAVATVPLRSLGGGRPATHIAGFRLLTEPNPMPPKPKYAKRVVKVAAIDSWISPEVLLQRLDEVGRQGCDLACTDEYVWISGGKPEDVAKATAGAKANLERVAAKAKQWGMYVLVAGVVDRLERNEAILFDRQGKEVWRYFKIVQTHPEQIVGDQVPVCDTDFGRFGCWICADEAHVEIPRALSVQGADMVFFPTQSWGTDATYREDRDISRTMNAGVCFVEVTHPSSEPNHRSKIMDSTGTVVARSPYNEAGYCLATIDLDHQRLRRYAREWTPFQRGGYLPEYQSDRTPKEYNDLFDVIRAQRRPELYRKALWPWPDEVKAPVK